MSTSSKSVTTDHVKDSVQKTCDILKHLKSKHIGNPTAQKAYDQELRRWKRLLCDRVGGTPHFVPHLQAQTFKQKKTYAMRVEQTVELTSPYIMFAKMSSSSWFANKYIYWYAYSLGKVRNMMYGVAISRGPGNGWDFKVKYGCSFNSLVILNQVMDHLKANGYNSVATLAKDKINPTIIKYTGESYKHDINISNVPHDKPFYGEFGLAFKQFLEHLQYAALPITGLCMKYEQFIDVCKGSRADCRTNKECRQFNWGETNCVIKADRSKASASKSQHKSVIDSEDEEEDIL
jgi:hypothetical protein